MLAKLPAVISVIVLALLVAAARGSSPESKERIDESQDASQLDDEKLAARTVLLDRSSFTFTGRATRADKPGVCCWPPVIDPDSELTQFLGMSTESEPLTIDLAYTIAQLSSADFGARAATTSRLAKLGIWARPYLLQLAKHENHDVRLHSNMLLEKIEERERKIFEAREEELLLKLIEAGAIW